MAADAAVVESSPTEALKNATPAERKTWRTTGELPAKEPPKEASKDSKQETEAASSPAAKTEVAAPAKVEEPAKSAPAVTEPKAKPEGAEARIKDLLAENKRLTAELEASRKAPTVAPAKIEEVAKPHRNDVDPKTGQPKYATDEAFEEAHEAYLTAKVTKDVEERHAKAQKEARVAEQNRLLRQRMQNGIKIVTERHPDFLEVMKAETTEKDGKKETVFKNPIVNTLKTNGTVDAWIMDSDNGMELLYHFAKNPEDLDRIQALSPFAAARELTLLEVKLSPAPSKEKAAESSPAKTTIKVPPEPAASIGGKGTPPVDEEAAAVEKGDFRAFAKTANEADWRKKKAS